MQQHGSDAIYWRNVSGECEAKSNAEPVDHVGQYAFAKIGDDQDNQYANKKGPLQGWKREAKAQVASDEEECGEHLYDWVHRRN